jgi:hypothetical protein
VRRHRTIWLLALFVTLFSALTPTSSGGWECEGRTCGTTPWFCCCLSPVDARDANCQSTTGPVSDTSACPTDCGCVLITRAVDVALRAAASSCSHFAFHPVLLAPASGGVVTLPAEVVARPIETRGPPFGRRTLSPPSLRAPPVA